MIMQEKHFSNMAVTLSFSFLEEIFILKNRRKKLFFVYILIEEKGCVLAFEAAVESLPSVRIKLGNNMVHDTEYKTDVPDKSLFLILRR